MGEQSLHDFVEQATGQSHLRVEQDLGDGFVRLHTSEADRRQAAQDIHCTEDILLEVMRNAKDAHASHIFIALSKEGSNRILTIIDDGEGIPPAMHEHVFEPRVTSKLDTSHKDAWGFHGRGMALYSISVNSESAVIAASDEGKGTALRVVTDTQTLPEKSDQSTFPTFELKEEGNVTVRGPRNLLRGACEFALEVRDGCRLYVGSPAEIASAIFEFGRSTLSPIDRAFCPDPQELPLVKRLAAASDPAEFASLASGMGLQISERTARRILDGSIPQAPEILSAISLRIVDTTKAKSPKTQKGRGALRLTKEEKDSLSQAASKAFSTIAESYYLDPAVTPTIRTNPESLSISIRLIPKS